METSQPHYLGPTSGFINLNGCFLATCESFSALPTSKYSLKGRGRVSHQRRQWQPTPVLLPGKSHRQRSMVGCSPWGRKESDTTERLHFHFSLFMHWRRQWHPTPLLLPGKSHGRRSLVGCSPWGRKESDTTELLHFHFSLSCIGEGNGNPLQYSCLENPRDGGAWWAAIYGVTQSRTRLKGLSSSSSSSFVTTALGN